MSVHYHSRNRILDLKHSSKINNKREPQSNVQDFQFGLKLISLISSKSKNFLEDLVKRGCDLYLESLYTRSVEIGFQCEMDFLIFYGNLLIDFDVRSTCIQEIVSKASQRISEKNALQEYFEWFRTSFWVLSLHS